MSVPPLLGGERKARGIFEGPEWAESLGRAGIPIPVWDQRFMWALENISEQPLQNTHAFLTDDYRLIQISLPNQLLGWVYFRIEPDDENCTLLWIEVRQIRRVG
jgi:hypothetical protein